jgi:hypothetical protein
MQSRHTGEEKKRAENNKILLKTEDKRRDKTRE